MQLTARNGRLPRAELVEVAPGEYLRPDAARSYAAMRRDGCPGGVTSGYRARAVQSWLWSLYRAGRGNTAARPGESFHGEGTALDLPEPARSWVREHGAPYGWVRDRVRREPWHLEYEPARDQHPHPRPGPAPADPIPGPAPAPAAPPPPPPPPEDTDVAHRIRYGSAVFLVNLSTGTFLLLPDTTHDAAVGDLAEPVEDVDRDRFDHLRVIAQYVLEGLTGRPTKVAPDGSVRLRPPLADRAAAVVLRRGTT